MSQQPPTSNPPLKPPPRPVSAPGARPVRPPPRPSGAPPRQPRPAPSSSSAPRPVGAPPSPGRPGAPPPRPSGVPPRPRNGPPPRPTGVPPRPRPPAPITETPASQPAAAPRPASPRVPAPRPTVSAPTTGHTSVPVTSPRPTVPPTGHASVPVTSPRPTVSAPTTGYTSVPVTSPRPTVPTTGRTSVPVTSPRPTVPTTGRTSVPVTSPRPTVSAPTTGHTSVPVTSPRPTVPTTGHTSVPMTSSRTTPTTRPTSPPVHSHTTRQPLPSKTSSSPRGTTPTKTSTSPATTPAAHKVMSPVHKTVQKATVLPPTIKSAPPKPVVIEPVPLNKEVKQKPVAEVHIDHYKEKVEYEKKLNDLRIEYEDRERELNHKMEKMKASCALFQSKIEEFSTTILEKDNHINMLRSQIHSPGIVSIELKTLTDENSELKLKLLHYQDLDQQHHELTEKYNELKVKYDTATEDIKQLQAYNNDLDEYSKELENELASIVQGTDVVHVHPEDIETLSSTLHDQLDERTKEELHEQNMMLFDTLQALQKQKELHEQQLTEQILTLKEEVTQLSALESQLYLSRKTVKEHEETIKQLKFKNESLKVIQTEYDKIVEENQRLHKENSQMIQDYNTLLELDKVNTESIELLEEVRLEYEDQLKKYEGNLKVSKSTIEELEARHSEDTDYIASLRDQINELKQAMAKMEEDQNQEIDEEDESITVDQWKAIVTKKSKDLAELNMKYQFMSQNLILQTWKQEYLTSMMPSTFIDECLLYINKLVTIRGIIINMTELWKNVMTKGYQPSESHLATSFSALTYCSELFYLTTVYMAAMTSNNMNESLYKQSLQATAKLFDEILTVSKSLNIEYTSNNEIITSSLKLSQLVDLLKPHVLVFIEQGDSIWREYIEHEMGSHFVRCLYVESLRTNQLIEHASEILMNELEDRAMEANIEESESEDEEDEEKRQQMAQQKDLKIRGYSYSDLLTMINLINNEFSDQSESIANYAKTLMSLMETIAKAITEQPCGKPTGADVPTKNFVGVRKEIWSWLDDLQYLYSKFNNELYSYCSKEEGQLLSMILNGAEGVQVKYRDAFDEDYKDKEGSLLTQLTSLTIRFSTAQAMLSGTTSVSTDFIFVNKTNKPNIMSQMANHTRKVLENSLALKEQLDVAIFKNQKQTELLKQKEKLIEQITVTKDTFIQKNEQCIQNENRYKSEIIELNKVIQENANKDEVIQDLTNQIHTSEREMTRLRKELKEYTNKDNHLSFMNSLHGAHGVSEYQYNRMKKLMEAWRSHALERIIYTFDSLPMLYTIDGKTYNSQGSEDLNENKALLQSINTLSTDIYDSLNLSVVDVSGSFLQEKKKIASLASTISDYTNQLSAVPPLKPYASTEEEASKEGSAVKVAEVMIPTQNRYYSNLNNIIRITTDEFIDLHHTIIH